MAHLSQPGPNMKWIEEVCNTLGRPYLTALINNHWPTADSGELVLSEGRNSSLFLLEGNPLLPMTPTDGCDVS